MKIERRLSQSGKPWDELIEWNRRDVEIRDHSTNSVVFRMEGVEAPANWSDHAVTICASKYFFKCDKHKETSVREVIHRMVHFWAVRGRDLGYFDEKDAQVFQDEIALMIALQWAAPNSPQWFNAGIDRYTKGTKQEGQFYCGPDSTLAQPTYDTYTYPQLSACFIQPVEDKLVGEGGIMDLLEREARLFKYGSGSGTNFSNLRAKGERLNNGGTAGGTMAWLEVGDRAAGSIKSGGTTRRAAKMVCMDVDHPEILDFIDWKVREELKVQSMVEGFLHLCSVNPDFAEKAKKYNLFLDYGFNGEAYHIVSGQNANNSVRVTDEFMSALESGGAIALRDRQDGKFRRGVKAEHIWDHIVEAAWACADPGLQFHDTINRWHTCSEDGEIRASNPCSEYMFLDDTACNLASLNLLKFWGGGDDPIMGFNIDNFRWAVRLWTIVLDISVSVASYPSAKIARKSQEYRTLGLGWANLGAYLMRSAVPYDSDVARAFAGSVTSLMTAYAYRTSVEMAKELGNFPRFQRNANPFRDVIARHREENDALDPNFLSNEARIIWDWLNDATLPFRNAQVTCIAPTGTISFVMDCETTGIEPFFSLATTKTLAGGGIMMIGCPAMAEALKRLGYPDDRVQKVQKQIGDRPIEDCDIDPADWYVFATAAGGHALPPQAHVYMMAAVQPFVSGAISKTVNLPETATKEDISNIYQLAWKSGLKSIAVYRDNCKRSQPLTATPAPKPTLDSIMKKVMGDVNKTHPMKRTVEQHVKTESPGEVECVYITDEKGRRAFYPAESKPAPRRTLSATRKGRIHKFRISGTSGYITVGEFDDGSPGEVFVRMSKAGSTVHGFCETIGRLISQLLQHGAGPRVVVDTLRGIRFDPQGFTDNPDLRSTSSVVDYVARWLEREYILPPAGSPAAANGPEGDLPLGYTTDGEEYIPGIDVAVPPVGQHPRGHDGPPCPTCGHIMVRRGTCDICLNCGTNGGCG